MPFSLHSVLHLAIRFTRGVVRVSVALVLTGATLALVAVALLPSTGARGMVVTSGSMEPEINVGGLVVVRDVDPETVEVGDVITFNGYSGEGLTTHRVLARRTVDGRLHFQTKGDANDTPDADLAPAEGVVGRVSFDVPYAGRVLAELQQPALRLAVLGVPSLWFLITHLLALTPALRERPRRNLALTATTVTGAALLVVAVVTGAAERPSTTAAALTDAAAIDGNTFTTGTW